MIAEELLGLTAAPARGRTVRRVCIGLGYTAVVLDDGSCGVAYTFAEEAGGHCAAMDRAGGLAGSDAAEVAQLSQAHDAVSAGVGMACINALLRPEPAAAEADVRQRLEARPGDVVGMVGYFRPLVPVFREAGATLHIFERQPQGPDSQVRADWAAPLMLPACDIAVISATTLINRTLDHLLECAAGARQRIVVGPTAPLVSAPFRERGVTLISGVEVVDADRMLEIVAEGGGTRQFGRAVRKLCLEP